MTNIPYFDDSNAPSDWEERAAAKRRKDEEEYHARANRAAELAVEVARLTAERDALRAALEGIAADFARPEKGLTDFGERQHYLHIACRLRDKARATLADNLTPRQETAG